MRNIKNFANNVLPTLAALLLLAPPVTAGRDIEILIFIPREPRAGAALKVEFSLSGNAEQAGRVELTVRTDRNGDRMFQADESSVTTVSFKDNGQGDEEPRANIVRLTVYQIPQDNPHQEYTVKVVVGQSSRTANVVKPGAQAATAQAESSGFWWLPGAVAEKLRRVKDAFSERNPGAGATAFAGAPSLYVYTLADQSLQRLTRGDARVYRSPAWSTDSKALAFVIVEGGAKRVAWIDLESRQEVVLTDGPDDSTPRWLPDNNHIVFLRGSKLHLVEKSTKKINGLDSPTDVNNVLGVLNGAGAARIIYTTNSSESSEESPVYMLELDSGLRPKVSRRMIYSPNWFLFGWISPDGRELLYWKDAAIYKVPADKIEPSPERKLIKDDNKHYDPSWSPDGRRIAFVSTLP